MRRHLIVLCAPVMLVGCIESSNPVGPARVDSESHWLSPCVSDAQCGSLACICGICTRACRHEICGGDAVCASFGGEGCDFGGACTTGCAVDDDCPGAMRCRDRVCDAPATCEADGECPDGAACRDLRCVPIEGCDDGVDDDGDGAADCADPDCLGDAACAGAAARFAPDAQILACGDPAPLVDPADPSEALVQTLPRDEAALDDLAHVAEVLTAIGAGLDAPVIERAILDVTAAIADVLSAIADTPAERCAAPACDPAALLAADLALIGEVMAAIERLDPGEETLLPFTDCILASARLRHQRRGLLLERDCPGHDGAAYDALLLDWREWAHDPGLRLTARCALRSGFDACAEALMSDPIGDEPGCAQ